MTTLTLTDDACYISEFGKCDGNVNAGRNWREQAKRLMQDEICLKFESLKDWKSVKDLTYSISEKTREQNHE
jgi:hypothetical protein